MSKCDLSIELENPSSRLQGGDIIRGVVKVVVSEDCKCNGLVVSLVWSTHGRGTRYGYPAVLHDIFKGDWTAGQQMTYPFEITVPNGPYSYVGHYLNVGWSIKALADIPWGNDSRARHPVIIVPGPNTDSESYLGGVDGQRRVSGLRKSNSAMLSKWTLLLSLPLLLHWLSRSFFVQDLFLISGRFPDYVHRCVLYIWRPLLHPLFGLIGFVLVLIGLGMSFRGLRNKIASMRLGDVEVDWPEGIIHAGDAYPISLQMNARKGVGAARATLICRETVVSQVGSDRETFRKDVFSAPVELRRFNETQGRINMRGELRLPENASPSFYAPNNQLSWLIELHIDVAKWPDWKRELYLDVRPARASAVEDMPSVESPFDESPFDESGAW